MLTKMAERSKVPLAQKIASLHGKAASVAQTAQDPTMRIKLSGASVLLWAPGREARAIYTTCGTDNSLAKETWMSTWSTEPSRRVSHEALQAITFESSFNLLHFHPFLPSVNG